RHRGSPPGEIGLFPEAIGVTQGGLDPGPTHGVGTVDSPLEPGESPGVGSLLDPAGDGVPGRVRAQVMIEAEETNAVGPQQGEGLLGGARDGIEAGRQVAQIVEIKTHSVAPGFNRSATVRTSRGNFPPAAGASTDPLRARGAGSATLDRR